MSIAKKYPLGSFEDSIIDKTMHSGSKTPVDCCQYVFDREKGIPVMKTLTYSPALIKCIDEIVVNCLDHCAKMREGPKSHQVTRIGFNMANSGEITVTNNGQGVPTEWHEVAEKYLPEIFFGRGYNGTNVKKDPDSTIGGTNGIGIKLPVTLSKYFRLETTYLDDQGKTWIYKQAWKGIKKPGRPERREAKSGAKLGTKVIFMPDYEAIFDTNFEANKGTLAELVNTRLIMASIFARWISQGQSAGPCSVYFGGEKIKINTWHDLAQKFSAHFRGTEDANDDGIFSFNVVSQPGKSPEASQAKKRFAWQVTAVVGYHDLYNGSLLPQITNINGIVAQSGKHVDLIIKKLHDAARDILKEWIGADNLKRLQKTYTYNNVFLFGNFLIPGEIWDSQRKDHATGIDSSYFRQFHIDSHIAEIAQKLAEAIYKDMGIGKKPKKAKAPQIVNSNELSDAKMAKVPKSKRKGKKCYLFMPEGFSALLFCRMGFSFKPKGAKHYSLDPDYVGIIALGGVIVNVQKWINREIVDDEDIERNLTFEQLRDIYSELNADDINDYFQGEQKVVLKQKLLESKFFNNFLRLTGLDINCSYDRRDKYFAEQMANLRYDAIVCFVDQDLDGKGLILSLILNIFITFWPNLFNEGFIKRFETPIIRLTHKNKEDDYIEFYNEINYEEWVKNNPDLAKKYVKKFLKGLAGNKTSEAGRLFKGFEKKLITYKADKYSRAIFENYFGPDSEPRKASLRQKYEHPPKKLIERQESTRQITIKDHMEYNFRAYQQMRVVRSIPNAIDGLVEVTRKILYACRLIWHNKESVKNKIKVISLQAKVQDKTHYEHGDGPIVKAIYGRMFICNGGGRQLPILLPDGIAPSRGDGGEKPPQPRYVFTVLNYDLISLMFPAQDDDLLDYRINEGERIEPHYFVPILPMSILECIRAPSSGWQVNVWARCAFDVISKLKSLISLDSWEKSVIEPEHILPLALCTCHFWGEVRQYKGKKCTFGEYSIDKQARLITITELPIRVWYNKYRDFLNKKRKTVIVGEKEYNIFNNIYLDKCNNVNIYIEIELAKATANFDPIDYIEEYYGNEEIDPYEHYFGLYNYVNSQLNMLDKDGVLIEFGSYERVMHYWYLIRRDMYKWRIDRQIIIKELEILRQKNILKLLENSTAVSQGLKKCEGDDEVDALMRDMGFDAFSSANYAQIKYFRTEDIRAKVLNEGNPGYDYLLNTKIRKVGGDRIAGQKKKIAGLEADLAQYRHKAYSGPFPGANIWLEEIEAIEKVIKKGKTTLWGENGKK